MKERKRSDNDTTWFNGPHDLEHCPSVGLDEKNINIEGFLIAQMIAAKKAIHYSSIHRSSTT